MLKWLAKTKLAVFFAFCILFTFQTDFAKSATDVSYEIIDVTATLTTDSLEYTLFGKSKPAYTVSERFAPFRVVIDIAGATLNSQITEEKIAVPKNDFSSLAIEDLTDQTPHIKRLIFTLADTHDYDVELVGNDIKLSVTPGSATNKTADLTPVDVRSLTDFKVESTPNSTTITILSNGPIDNYTVDTIGSGANRPPRMYIDIEDVAINELVPEKQIGTSVDKVRVAARGKGARIVFDSASQNLFTYTVAPSPNGLSVVIDETNKGQTISNETAANVATAAPASTTQPQGDTTLDALIGSSEKLLSQDPDEIVEQAAQAQASALEDSFSFSGYKKQRISVDFYKIDIHNVFRLFRQITDLNIIVDEQVEGVLTLALTDVPWDFALDIILNLMDLKKEERFNTIVIYPAKKEFVWPTRAENNLAFEADVEVIEQEALVIEKSNTLSKEIMLAKEFMAKAQDLETREEFENASLLYIKALELWPENIKISNKLATLYLVNLGFNAKAVYYAKESLKQDPQNAQAALYAAIGSANMQRISEAKEYFSQSISNSPPMKEALISFAAFSENNSQNEAALKLLDKYDSYYGENLETMVSKARILDKLGKAKEATKQYQAILTSGFQIRSDLKKYIEGRLAAKDLY
ncbi:AMIN domain-containing protein [Desulforhopalus sp. IMCC35007]|uniref:AMIN domain-containing protein n=1 Tax=Desulforhopalus sp. IMCC35007 TaxID=2569543 RepID=UPI0010ADA63E|nr:AMIN domain-containing protein [Desulforhopalus sp. IMCC35007]TKB12085.1 AMIN domain-containing protein [Desulforhopalus sp. IMCC35007]